MLLIYFFHFILQNYVFCTCQIDFLRQLVLQLRQYTFFPGNPIAFENEINDTMYFIFYGEVEILTEGKDLYNPEFHGILREGDAFGVVRINYLFEFSEGLHHGFIFHR